MLLFIQSVSFIRSSFNSKTKYIYKNQSISLRFYEQWNVMAGRKYGEIIFFNSSIGQIGAEHLSTQCEIKVSWTLDDSSF